MKMEGVEQGARSEEAGGIVACHICTEQYKPSLSLDEMAKLMGLHLAFMRHVCGVCKLVTPSDGQVWLELDQGEVGFITRTICGGCVPGEFVKHMKSQAAMDALVEEHQHGEVCAHG